MEYASIIASSNNTVCSYIEYNNPIDDYIVYCKLDFYVTTEETDDVYYTSGTGNHQSKFEVAWNIANYGR